MITLVNHTNLHLHGQLLVGQFKLRHKEFIERQSYEVKTFDGMEYDEYDTPATSYLIYQDADGIVQGVSRLTPVVNGCMLQDLWPQLVDDESYYARSDIWESSRFCINKDLPAKTRRTICYELALANVEFGLQYNIKKVIGMMPTLILRSVFERSGIFLERLGPIRDIPGFAKVQAAAIPINRLQTRNVFKKTGVAFAINNNPEYMDLQKAA